MIEPELIVDNFAGGGGASTGIELALGRSPDVAVNHDPEAVAMHTANHPDTHHLCGNVWEYDPREVAQGRPVGLLWASPDCKHFSKAKGGAPSRSTKIRALAWVVVRWARTVRPRVIILENVEEFLTWGPLLDDGSLCSRRKGKTFRAWVSAIRREGYQVEWRQLRACDYGAPTTRKRLFIIARCDGAPIVWPEPTHGEGLDLFTLRAPYRTAAECIDWSLPVRSIFGRKKPLAEATLKRIALGIERFVTGKTPPFIVGDKAHALIQTGYGERDGQTPRVLDLDSPMGTIVAGGVKQGLVATFLAKHYGGNGTPGSALSRPFDTITTRDHHALVAAFLTKYNGTGIGQPVDVPLATVTTRDRFALVTVAGEAYRIVDIGMRMLTPRELFLGQGFPSDYVIDPVFEGKHLSVEAQVRMAGNSVCPPMAAALVAANYGEREERIAA